MIFEHGWDFNFSLGSGESRSLMKELAHVVAREHLRFNTLKLMVCYRNKERMLADSLGANDGITIIYHHDTFPYKYRGRLRVQSILSSVHYVMTLSPDELPLKSLTSPEGLNDFLDSTDKAVLLLEFCGWIPRLLAKGNNKAESDLGMFSLHLFIIILWFYSFWVRVNVIKSKIY